MLKNTMCCHESWNTLLKIDRWQAKVKPRYGCGANRLTPLAELKWSASCLILPGRALSFCTLLAFA